MNSADPIFGSWRFARLVEKPNLALLHADKDSFQRLLVYVNDGVAHCPRSGPYAHYAFTSKAEHEAFFIRSLEQLKYNTVKKLIARLPPTFYSDWVIEANHCFKRKFDSTETVDINYHLSLNKPFITSLPPDQKRVLRMAEEAGYRCRFSTDWGLIREVVSTSRLGKGFGDAISLELLLKLVQAFPDNYQGIVCYRDGEAAGAGVLVRVDARIQYLFYVANYPAHLRYSPSLQIIGFCAGWAQEHGYSILDLGTASKDGVVNEGVRAFKKSIGGVESHKSTFDIKL